MTLDKMAQHKRSVDTVSLLIVTTNELIDPIKGLKKVPLFSSMWYRNWKEATDIPEIKKLHNPFEKYVMKGKWD